MITKSSSRCRLPSVTYTLHLSERRWPPGRRWRCGTRSLPASRRGSHDAAPPTRRSAPRHGCGLAVDGVQILTHGRPAAGRSRGRVAGPIPSGPALFRRKFGNAVKSIRRAISIFNRQLRPQQQPSNTNQESHSRITSVHIARAINANQRIPPLEHHDLLTITEAAVIVRAPVATLRYWRHVGTGPRSFRLGKRVVYKAEDIRTWIDEQSDHGLSRQA